MRLSNHCRRVTLSQFVFIILMLGTCQAEDQEIAATPTDDKMFSMSGDLSGGVGYSDLDYDPHSGAELRWQLTAKPLQDLEFTTRLTGSRSFDSEPPDNTDFLVDRCFVSWDEIGDLPLRLTGGRLPTRGDTSPGHLSLGLDQPQGWLSSFADIVLDGVALEYRYQFLSPGRLRFYYATQTDAGYEGEENDSGLTETEIYGLQWDMFHHKSRSIQLQSLLIADFWSIPEDVTFVNPVEYYAWEHDPADNPLPELDRKNLGDVYQTSLTYLDKVQDLNFFVDLGWSHTNAKAMDEMGTTLLGSWWNEPQDRDGFALYAGLRYDLDWLRSKVGFEYNYGSKYWIGLSQKTATSKLATRGSVAEVYWTVEPPLPAMLANVSRTLIGRLGYQYYDYDYTGSGFWLAEPLAIDSFQDDPLAAQFYSPADSAYLVSASLTLYY